MVKRGQRHEAEFKRQRHAATFLGPGVAFVTATGEVLLSNATDSFLINATDLLEMN